MRMLGVLLVFQCLPLALSGKRTSFACALELGSSSLGPAICPSPADAGSEAHMQPGWLVLWVELCLLRVGLHGSGVCCGPVPS